MEKSGEQRKQDGQNSVSINNHHFLQEARREALRVFRRRGHVTIDDLRKWSRRAAVQPQHPNAWGCVFRGDNWVPIGHINSKYPTNHGRAIRVWRWVA